ncbi:MAG: hybrid sensor histidine kinase/response regulator [Deltaproteobacteria bacterium]|nr:hybrid sensor histidine kinase/response regulator [Deltaproteobacteria bacterium]
MNLNITFLIQKISLKTYLIGFIVSLSLFIFILFTHNKTSVSQNVQNQISLWEEDLALAIVDNNQNFFEKFSKNLHATVQYIEVYNLQKVVYSYPVDSEMFTCLFPLKTPISRYGAQTGEIKTCLYSGYIIKATLFSPFLLFYLVLCACLTMLLLSERLEKQKALEQIKNTQALCELASQVSHDIRSPLAALNLVLKDLHHLPENTRILLRSAVQRIQDIANDLLNKHKKTKPLNTNTSNDNTRLVHDVSWLPGIIESSVSEKRLSLKSQDGMIIETRLSLASYSSFSKINQMELKRILSNILNNSIDAMKNNGKVFVSLSNNESFNLISIEDTGKGIPEEILKKLGTRGFSYGKSNGNGLGLHHAKSVIEQLGGKFEIQSKLNHGTEITICIPKTELPKWFVSKLIIPESASIIILDDDPSIHQIWKNRIEVLNHENKNIEILDFYNTDTFLLWIEKHHNIMGFFLIDYEIFGSPSNGFDVINKLNLKDKAVLVTSRYEEPLLIEQCEAADVKLLPKNLAPLVQIEIAKGKTIWPQRHFDDTSRP